MVRLWQKTGFIIISVLFCLKSVEAATTSEIAPKIQFYKDFLMKINEEENFDSYLIYGEVRMSETFNLMLQMLAETFSKPIILQNANSSYQIANLFNNDVLVIAQLESFEIELPMLADVLNRMRQKRIVLIRAEPGTASNTKQYLTQHFRLCETLKMLNVVVIFVDFPQTKMFYSYTIFPKFQLEEKLLSSSGAKVFPRRMKNLHGYGIRTKPDQSFPFSFTYELDGRIKVGGYLQNLLKTFARSINATLVHPVPVKLDHYELQTVINMTLDNILDIPISRIYLLNIHDLDQASIPFGISAICLVAPVKWYHTFENFYGVYTARTYLFLLSSGFVTFTLLFYCRRLQYKVAGKPHNISFLGALINPNYFACQLELQHSAKLPRLVTIRVLVCLSMIWTLCVYTHFAANLNTFVTKHIMVPIPTSWEDLYRFDYKVLISWNIYNYISRICGDFCKHLDRSLVFADTMDEVLNEFFKLNTTYAYSADLFFWKFLKFRMRAMNRPSFRLTDICFRRHLMSSVRLPENSVFKEAFNLFITRYAAHGLDNVWLDSTLLETEKFGKFRSTTHPSEQLGGPLDMAYLSFMWKMFGISWTLGIFIFACEVVIGRWQRRIPRNTVSKCVQMND